jgi:hypothetical protein
MRVLQLLSVSAAIVCLTVPATASAQSWRQVYRDTQVNVSIDTARISRTPEGAYTLMMRWNYASPRRAENRKPYSRLIQQVQLRCRPTPIRVKRYGMALYTATGTLVEEARPLSSGELRLMDWERPRPRSEGARVYPIVCSTLTSLSRRNA